MADIPVLEAAPAGKGKKADKAGKTDKPDKGKAEAAPSAGKKKLILFIAIGVVVLGGGGVGGWLMFAGKHAEVAESKAEGKGKSKKAASKSKEKDEEKDEGTVKGPPIFVPLDPPFVVNFEAEQSVRFLQVTAQVMSRDPETIELLKTNDPIIRNDMLLLLGNQNYQTVSTREGKEALRAQALEAVRKVVTGAGGKSKAVEAVYFTSFVMQ